MTAPSITTGAVFVPTLHAGVGTTVAVASAPAGTTKPVIGPELTFVRVSK
jgi:hypothetical protein